MKIAYLASIAATFMLVGCASVSSPEKSAGPNFQCSPPADTRLGPALEQARRDLVHADCRDRFQTYWQALLAIGAKHKRTENAAELAHFVSWSRDEGLLSPDEAKVTYSRYFDTRFVTLPDDYSVCAYARDFSELERSLVAELRQKEQGLLRVAGDKAAYQTAFHRFEGLMTLFDAAHEACHPS